ncbi:hypothetical protein TNCV_3696481 [Trichonephila clavipes]|nr:hypothetical protein TNCV_3696481 [Trichonephila clavipes]
MVSTKTDNSGTPQNYENEHLQELWDDVASQTQKQLAKTLNMSHETISGRLRATGNINKLGQWVPHDLNDLPNGKLQSH